MRRGQRRRVDRRWWRAIRVPVVLGAVAASVLAGCANVTTTTVSHAGDTDGVTPTLMEVGALASLSGFASSDFAPVVTGAKAYFDRLNAAGGVDGRKIIYSPILDDGTSPSGDTSAAQLLVQDRVFAVVGVATPFFTGSSILRAQAVARFHVDTPVVDLSIPYGAASLDADVTRMQQNGVDFVATCMDTTGDIKLSQTLQQHGMGTAVQYWLDGYDQQTLQNNHAAMDGVYFLLQQTPFE